MFLWLQNCEPAIVNSSILSKIGFNCLITIYLLNKRRNFKLCTFSHLLNIRFWKDIQCLLWLKKRICNLWCSNHCSRILFLHCDFILFFSFAALLTSMDVPVFEPIIGKIWMGDYEHSNHDNLNVGSSSQKRKKKPLLWFIIMLLPIFSLDHFYRIEGQKDYLLCGNSSDAG